MITAKEKYYLSGYSNQSIVIDYVTELEQELTKLKESQTQLCNRVDKAEADKAELVEFVRDIAYNDINKNDLDIDWVQKESWELLNKHTDKCFQGVRDPIHDYVAELEQELAKLKESQTQKSIIKLCNRMDKAEAENVGLKKAISFYYTYHKDSRNDGVIFEEFNKICPMK